MGGLDAVKCTRIKSRVFRKAKTPNLYHGLLLKLYSFLARRTDSKFNKIVNKRLNGTNTMRYPMSLSRLCKVANTDEKKGKILVLVGKILDDERLFTVPKMRVCALKVSDHARARIVKAGGEVLTFDQLAKVAPLGENTLLLRGRRSRETLRHHGAPDTTNAKPYVKGSHEKDKNHKKKIRSLILLSLIFMFLV